MLSVLLEAVQKLAQRKTVLHYNHFEKVQDIKNKFYKTLIWQDFKCQAQINAQVDFCFSVLEREIALS